MKHKHIIPHKAVADRLAAQGLKITKEAVGQFRNGKTGSKHADKIRLAEAELMAEKLRDIRRMAQRIYATLETLESPSL